MDFNGTNQIETLIVDVEGETKDNATWASIDEIGRITAEHEW